VQLIREVLTVGHTADAPGPPVRATVGDGVGDEFPLRRDVVRGERDGGVFRKCVGVDEHPRGRVERIRHIKHGLVLAAIIALEEVALAIPRGQTEAFESPQFG